MLLNVKGMMVKNKIKLPRVRRAAVRTWSGLKATENRASRAWRDAKAKEKRPTYGCNSAGTNSRDVQQSARGLV
jgi:hypothetical protein